MICRRYLTHKFILYALLFLNSNLGFAQEKDIPIFLCSAIPSQNLEANFIRFGPFASYLESKLGVPVRYVTTTSYEATVEAFARHDVHLAWFGGLTGVQARRLSPGAEAIAQGAEDENFKSYFIANTRSGLLRSTSFPDTLRGKSFTFGSKVSTSGRLMPEFFIRKHLNGLGPAQIFSEIGFSGDHLKTLEAVQSGRFDAGVLDYRVFDAESKAGRVDADEVRIIWETPAYPDYQFTIQGDLGDLFGPGFKSKVRQAILDLNDKAILGKFGRSKFIPASNSQYGQIEKVLEQLSAEGALESGHGQPQGPAASK
jgi:phosphonate transport system substrate-binding protein